MRRTDRLFDLIQTLRDGRLHRASDMAAGLGVSVRTVWRDMATLIASGLPIEGERGVGYILRVPSTLPPLMLGPGELEALHQGLRLVAACEDNTMARAARALLAKITAALPMPIGDAPDTQPSSPPASPSQLPMIRAAIKGRQRLLLTYVVRAGFESFRDVRPLHLDLSSSIWTLATWCETRGGFHRFRLDRIVEVATTGETFADEPGKTWQDFNALDMD